MDLSWVCTPWGCHCHAETWWSKVTVMSYIVSELSWCIKWSYILVLLVVTHSAIAWVMYWSLTSPGLTCSARAFTFLYQRQPISLLADKGRHVTLVSLATVSAGFERVSCRICGGQSGNETDLLVFRFSSDNRLVTAPVIQWSIFIHLDRKSVV